MEQSAGSDPGCHSGVNLQVQSQGQKAAWHLQQREGNTAIKAPGPQKVTNKK